MIPTQQIVCVFVRYLFFSFVCFVESTIAGDVTLLDIGAPSQLHASILFASILY